MNLERLDRKGHNKPRALVVERGERVTRKEHELVAREFVAFEIETHLLFIYLI